MRDRLRTLNQQGRVPRRQETVGRGHVDDSPDFVSMQELGANGGTAEADFQLPPWYVPEPATGRQPGWRRRVALLIMVSFLVLAAYGFCSSQGLLGLG